MKKIATPFAFFSFCHKVKRHSLLGSVLFVAMLSGITMPAQSQQVIGSFPEMEGGFENTATMDTGGIAVPANYQLNLWRGAYTSLSTTTSIYTTTVRTGTKSLQWLTTGSNRLLYSRSGASTSVANSPTSYVVQFYWYKAHSSSVRSLDISISPAGSSAFGAAVNTGSLGVSAPSFEWTKQTVVVTPGTSAASPRYGIVRFSVNGGSIPTPGYLYDDFCVYPGSAPDVTAPADVTSPVIASYTSTSLTPSWTAPAGGVDGGGYVVLRYTSNPSSEPSPNVNGIYAVGNTIGTGTIAYIGTNTSFTDAGLSTNTAYYYKVYAVDKAFNYSSAPTVFAGFTGIAGTTAITFTTPATCLTDRLTLTWTGPLNYKPITNTIVAFIKQGSAVTTGTPTNAASVYTENTVFGAGTPYQNDAAAYCIYNGDGTDAGGDHSGLTITGLAANTTYHLLIYNIVDAGPSYSAAGTINSTTLNALAEPANNAASFAKGTVATNNIQLNWVAAGGSPAPTGYLIKASNSATPADPVDFTDPADQTNISSGTANAKTTGVTYNGFSGFSAGTMYYFRNSSYTNSGACINFKPTGPAINVATLPNAVTAQALSITGGTGTINWSGAAGYNNTNHTTLVFVSSSAITVGTPTVNPTGYTANTAFGAGTPYQLDANARCVYNGDGTSVTVTGLVSGTTYYVLILTVVNAANYDLTHSYSAYATTNTTYTSTFEYTWQGGASGSWATATNWTPNRTSTTTNDVLIFNTPGNVTATGVTEIGSIAKLAINAGNVTLQSAAAFTLTITHVGVASTDLTIVGGASLTLGTTVNMTLGTNSTASIVGTLNVNSANTYNTDNAGAITTIAGTLNNYNVVTSTVATRFIVNGGGTYNHARNGGTIPTGTWNTNSTCLITGTTSNQNFSGHRQRFSNFVWDCAGQSNTHFVLGENSSSTPPVMEIVDSFIVKRTNGKILQISSTGGQRDLTCGNYFQYGGLVAITYNTDASGEQRSLTVNKTFYVTDSIESNAKFQIINNPGGQNIVGRLYVGGDVEMHPTISSSTIERVIGGAAALAELWFNGSAAQWARFSTISGNIDFVTNQTGTGVTLRSNATANLFKLIQGTFFIASNTLTINNVVSYPAPGTGTMGGSSTSNLIMGLSGNSGTLNFASGSRILKDYTQLTGNTTTLGTELAITAGVVPGSVNLGTSSVLNTNDNLVLKSDIDGTSRISAMTAPLATVNGKVQVERFLPMNLNYDSRRWRLVTAPFKANANAPTINAGWQEGAVCPDRFDPNPYNPRPGYGTHITRSTSAGNGFDQGSQNNPSIFYYNNATNSWVVPANTTSIKITDNYGVYQLFARGDRSIVIQNQYVPANPATLAPKGDINIGDVVIPMLSSGFQPIGNPYASQIKIDNIDFNGTLGKSKTIYLWDPKALGSSGVGAFITCSGNGGTPATYTYTGNSSNYGSNPGVIESSGAFMVAATGGNTTFHETDKTANSSTIGVASRPSVVKQITGSLGKIGQLYIDLIGTRNGQPSLADGIAITYNKHYSNDVDEMDALKLLTFATKERIGIQKEDALYSIERRNTISEKDTIQLSFSRLNKMTYKLDLRVVDLDDEFTAYIEDRFTKTKTAFTLIENSSFSFDITDDSLSAAANRFFISFKRNKPVINNEPAGITIFPNPVKNGKINVRIPVGEYSVRLINDLGQVIYRNRLIHQTENNNEIINIGSTVAKGVYKLEIISAEKRITTVNVIIQ